MLFWAKLCHEINNDNWCINKLEQLIHLIKSNIKIQTKDINYVLLTIL